MHMCPVQQYNVMTSAGLLVVCTPSATDLNVCGRNVFAPGVTRERDTCGFDKQHLEARKTPGLHSLLDAYVPFFDVCLFQLHIVSRC